MAPLLANALDFLTFWPEPVILRGCNTSRFRKQQPIQNSGKIPGHYPENYLRRRYFTKTTIVRETREKSLSWNSISIILRGNMVGL